MRTRLVASVVALLAVTAVPSQGAMRQLNQVVDPKGDAKANLGFADIVTGRWTTVGRGDQRALVATLTLAGAPRTDPGFSYELSAQVDGCGPVQFTYRPFSVTGTGLGPKSFYIGCGAPDDIYGTMSLYDEVTLTIGGRTITWSVPLIALPREVNVGATYREFGAIADVAEPLTGSPLGMIGGTAVDIGFGAAVWRLR